MELLLLDSVFGVLGRVDDFESLQWTSRYYDVGSYKLILDTSAFDPVSYTHLLTTVIRFRASLIHLQKRLLRNQRLKRRARYGIV